MERSEEIFLFPLSLNLSAVRRETELTKEND
jgi:hypothetical protein